MMTMIAKIIEQATKTICTPGLVRNGSSMIFLRPLFFRRSDVLHQKPDRVDALFLRHGVIPSQILGQHRVQ